MKRLLAALLLLAAANFASAQAPSLMSYQGRVTDSAGVAIGNSSPVNRLVTFKFYSLSTGGTPVYVESQTATISGGEFSVLLGNGNGVATFYGPAAPAISPYRTLASILTGPVYLGITVDDGTAAVDNEISPRQQIVSAAYAIRAKVAETVLDGALNTAMLANTSVTTDKLGGASVTNAKLAVDAVNTTNIVAGSITDTRIANGAVTTAKILDGAVTAAKIADGVLATVKLADNSITSAKIVDGAVTSADIADGTIATADIAASAITNVKIADGAIDLNKIIDAVRQSLVPAGTIVAFGGETIPAGWRLCDGSLLNRSDFPALFAALGTNFGADNTATFRVPDLRGVFLRGRDRGTGRDVDRNSRITIYGGGATGDLVGSYQPDQLASHNHDYGDIYHSEYRGSISLPDNRGSGDTDGDNTGYEIGRTTGARGGSETRPKNVMVNYIVKL
ncbi:tail fiber protein [Oleiharenicola lentus]|uniref:tail fiber protein n=1 Tax=Oleiharenicola lentus TaxID=2508720 RepID=UPI003F670E45